MARASVITRRSSAVVTAFLAAAVCASSADADTYCVVDPGCVAAGGTAQATLQGAFDAANLVSGRDRVEIGSVSLPAGGTATEFNPVQVVGAGQGATEIAGGGTIVALDSPQSTISDLTIGLDSNDSGALTAAGTVERVTIAGSSSLDETAVELASGAVARRLTVALPTGPVNSSTGIVAVEGPTTIEHSSVSANRGVITVGTLRRSSVTAGFYGVDILGSYPAGGKVDQVTIRMSPGLLSGLSASGSVFLGPADAEATHVTVVGTAGAGVVASAGCGFSGSGVDASLRLRNVIVRGFEADRRRTGIADCNSGAPVAPAAAAMDTAYSIFDPSTDLDDGPGSLIDGPGNLNADPLLADPGGGDLRLLAGSPAIDAGDPSAVGVGESATDLAGAPRVTDGDGDGTARRDIGAFEKVAPPTPPATVPSQAEIERLLKLSYSKRKDRFKGKLRSEEPECRRGKVKVFRKRGGPDKKVGADNTNQKGKWSFGKDAAPGRYYAAVKASEVAAGTCEASKSKPKKVA